MAKKPSWQEQQRSNKKAPNGVTKSKLSAVPKAKAQPKKQNKTQKVEPKKKSKSGWQQIKDAANPKRLASGVGQFGVDVVKTGFGATNPMTYYDLATGNEGVLNDVKERLPAIYDTGASFGRTGKNLASVPRAAVEKAKAGDYIGAAENASLFLPGVGPAANPFYLSGTRREKDGVIAAIEGTNYEDRVKDGTIVTSAIEDIGNVATFAGGAGLGARMAGKAATRGLAAEGQIARKFALGADDALSAAEFNATNPTRLAKVAKLENRAAKATQLADNIDMLAQPFVSVAKGTKAGARLSSAAGNLAKTKIFPKVGKYAAMLRPEARTVRKEAGDITAAMSREQSGVIDSTIRASGIAPEGHWSAVMEMGERTAQQWGQTRASMLKAGEAGKAAWDRYKQELMDKSKGRVTDVDIDLAIDANAYRAARRAGDSDLMKQIKADSPDAVRVADALDEVSKGEFGATQAAKNYAVDHPEQMRAELLYPIDEIEAKIARQEGVLKLDNSLDVATRAVEVEKLRVLQELKIEITKLNTQAMEIRRKLDKSGLEAIPTRHRTKAQHGEFMKLTQQLKDINKRRADVWKQATQLSEGTTSPRSKLRVLSNKQQRLDGQFSEAIGNTVEQTREALDDPINAPAILRPYLQEGKASRETLHQFADEIEAGDPAAAAAIRQDADLIVTNLEEFRREGLLEGIIDPATNAIDPEGFGAFFSHSPVSEYFDDMAEGNTAFSIPNPPSRSNVIGGIKKQAGENLRTGSNDFVRTPQAYVIRRMNEIAQRMTRQMWDRLTETGVLKNLEDPQFEGTLWRRADSDLMGRDLAPGEFVRDGIIYMPLKEGLDAFNKTADFPFDLVNPRDPLGRALKDWPDRGSIQWERGELRLVPRDIRNSFEKRMTRKHGMGEDFARIFFDKPNQFMKMFVLALSPAWHVGNLFGNSILAMAVGGVTPLQLAQGIKKSVADYRKSGRSRSAVKAELKSKGASREALRSAKTERSFYNADNRRLETSGLAQAQQEFLSRPLAAGPIRSQLDKVTGGRRPLEAMVQRSYEMNSFVDNIGRSAVYNAKIKRGMSPEVAVKESLNAMGDFSRMTPFEQNYIRRIMPFYAWQRHVTQFALRLPFEHPYRVAWLTNLGNIYGNEEGLINLWGDTYINSGNIVPFADWGAFLTPGSAKDAIAKGMAPVPRIILGDATDRNLSRGGDVDWSMPPGSEGEAPSIRNQVSKAFLGKQIRLADGLRGKDQISRYDNGDPRFRGSSAVPYKSENRSRLAALGGYAGFNIGSPDVAADINKSKTKKKNDLAKTKKRYEAKKKMYGG